MHWYVGILLSNILSVLDSHAWWYLSILTREAVTWLYHFLFETWIEYNNRFEKLYFRYVLFSRNQKYWVLHYLSVRSEFDTKGLVIKHVVVDRSYENSLARVFIMTNILVSWSRVHWSRDFHSFLGFMLKNTHLRHFLNLHFNMMYAYSISYVVNPSFHVSVVY